MERAGQFPARVKLGKASVGWHQTEVEKWLEDRERVSERSHGSEGLRGHVMGNQLGLDSELPFSLGRKQSKGEER